MDDIAQVRRIVHVTRRRTIVAGAASGFIASVVMAGMGYWLVARSVHVALFLGVFSLMFIATPLVMYWWKHWQGILAKLQRVEDDVRAGKVVYGDQVRL